MSVLYLVSTPIGNLKDITLRALETLKEADIIACEDTRHSAVLLNHYGIRKPLISYHRHNEKIRSEEIINHLQEGKSVALISDAGTPLISDPGAVIVREAREKGIEVTVIPGASAVISAVSLAGIDTGFVFVGFLPDKKKFKDQILKEHRGSVLPVVFYVSPHDVNNYIKDIYEAFGERKAYLIKELTKIYEGVTEINIKDYTIDNPKGEFVLIVMPEDKSEDFVDLSVREHVISLINKGLTKKEAVKAAAKDRGINRNEVYQETIDIKE